MGNNNQNVGQVTSEATLTTHSPDPVDELQRDVLENFSEVETIRLSRVDSKRDVYFGTVVIKGKISKKDRIAIAGRLMTHFIDRYQTLLLPVFENSKASNDYGFDVPSPRLFDPTLESEVAINRFSQLKDLPEFPRSIRRWYISTVREYSDALESVLSSVPSEIALTACLEMVRSIFVLLFASKEKAFSHDPDAIVFFRDQFVIAGSGLLESDLLLYFQLLALKQQALSTASEPTSGYRREFESLMRPIYGLFKRFERYISNTYTSVSEKRFRKRLALWSLFGVVSVVSLFALVGYIVSLIAMKNPVRVDEKKSGGIVGQYYKGKSFDERILTRVDKQINFSSKGRLAPRLPKNHFSIRWSGFLKVENGGKQRICLDHDDGCRLFFYEDLIIDKWKRGGRKRSCATINARKGWHPIKVEYFEYKGKARLRLLQGKTDDSVEVVSDRNLCCLE